MKTITVEEIITWLQDLPEDTVVYQPDGGANYCTIATYVKTTMGLDEVNMGYTTVSNDLDIIANIEEEVGPFIERWDDKAGEKGLTARQALDVVKDL